MILLKIIGFLLLAVIALMLLVIAAVLCTPLRYRVQGGYADHIPDIRAKFSIWFSSIAAYVSFTEEGLSVQLRFFFLRRDLVKSKVIKERTGGAAFIRDQADAANTPPEGLADSAANTGFEGKSPPVSELNQAENIIIQSNKKLEGTVMSGLQNEVRPEKEEITKYERKNETSEDAPGYNKHEESEKNAGAGFLNKLRQRLKDIWDKLISLINRFKNLYQSLKRGKKAVGWFLDQPSTKHTLTVVKRQSLKIVKSILPRKLTGKLRLGFENPEMMGRLCSIGGMFYPMYSKHFTFTPVFGEQVTECECYFRGRVILGAILLHLLPVVLMRDFYRVLKNLKRLRNKLS